MTSSSHEIILQVQDLSVRFGGIKALTNVGFAVKTDSITAIIGPNGAGKTTVFNCITGFYRPTTGQILWRQQDQAINVVERLGEKLHAGDCLNPATLGRKLYYKMLGGSHQIGKLGIARTFQNIRLFREMTVLENLLVAQHRHLNRNVLSGLVNWSSYRRSEKEALTNARKWLELVGLQDSGNRLAGELPYGHQRRLEIARAMATGCQLICLDEPAAGLNHRETADLAQLIQTLRSEHRVTVLVIEHDMSLVMNISDHIVVLDHGEVLAQGTPTEVRTNPQVLAAYLGDEAL